MCLLDPALNECFCFWVAPAAASLSNLFVWVSVHPSVRIIDAVLSSYSAANWVCFLFLQLYVCYSYFFILSYRDPEAVSPQVWKQRNRSGSRTWSDHPRAGRRRKSNHFTHFWIGIVFQRDVKAVVYHLKDWSSLKGTYYAPFPQVNSGPWGLDVTSVPCFGQSTSGIRHQSPLSPHENSPVSERPVSVHVPLNENKPLLTPPTSYVA